MERVLPSLELLLERALPHIGIQAPGENQPPPVTRATPGEPQNRRFAKPVPAPPIEADPGEGDGAGKFSYGCYDQQ